MSAVAGRAAVAGRVAALFAVVFIGGCAKRDASEAPGAMSPASVSVSAPEPMPTPTAIPTIEPIVDGVMPVEQAPAEGGDINELLAGLDGPAGAPSAAPAAPPPPPAQRAYLRISDESTGEELRLDPSTAPQAKQKRRKAEVANAFGEAEERGEAEETEDLAEAEKEQARDRSRGEPVADARRLQLEKLSDKATLDWNAEPADQKPKDGKADEAQRTANSWAAKAPATRAGAAKLAAPKTGKKLAGRHDGPDDDDKDQDDHDPDDQSVAPDRFAAMLTGLDDRDREGRAIELAPDDPERFIEPARTLPRTFYFENTYLGGNAAYAERLRRLDDALGPAPRPYRRAALPGQPFDAPTDAGLALTAALDRPFVDRPQRVHLQIGLQGSRRYGWRRPPLDVVLVVDHPVLGDGGEALTRAVTELLRRLGPQDRLGVVLAGRPPRALAALAAVRDLRTVLARRIEALEVPTEGGPDALAQAMHEAGAALSAAAGDEARIPGSGTVIVLTADADPARVAAATAAAHALTVQGATTSVIALAAAQAGGWWPVANAGHGNDHRATPDTLGAALDAELDSISRVIARLLRINIRLAPGVEAIRILGSRKLDEAEVRQVKAREEATDRNLSRSMGLKADRGADDDGIQTVIPYFYGGDSHVILVELWVTRPGPVAEVTLKYKDMVELDNATARAAVTVDRVPRPRGPVERRVAANVRGFRLAEGLADAARSRDAETMLNALDGLDDLALGADAAVLRGFEALVRQRGADPTVAEALRMARDRRIGHFER